mgnify:FL=1
MRQVGGPLSGSREVICKFAHVPYLPERQRIVKGGFASGALAMGLGTGETFATMANIPLNRINELREKKDLTIEQLSEMTGLSVSQISRLAASKRNLSVANLNKLAAALDVSPKDILEEAPLVPVVGYVGAGAEMHHYALADSPDEFVPMPENGNENTVAVEIRGSSLGSIFDSWLVYYDQIHTPPTPNMLGKLCVVGLADDRVLVKRLRKGSAPGLYNLESNTEGLIEDVEVAWAAKVKTMTPR